VVDWLAAILAQQAFELAGHAIAFLGKAMPHLEEGVSPISK
jgi:hypothetical protein